MQFYKTLNSSINCVYNLMKIQKIILKHKMNIPQNTNPAADLIIVSAKNVY